MENAVREMSVSASRLVAYAMYERKKTALPDGIPAQIRPSPLFSREMSGYGEEASLVFSHTAGGILFHVTAKADAKDLDFVTYFAAVPTDPKSPPELLLRRLRGEGFLMLYASHMAKASVKGLRILFCNEESGESHLYTEEPSFGDLSRFAEKLLPLLLSVAYPEEARLRRAESFRELRFPLPDMREGQRDLIEAAEAAFVRGGRIFASAPTGTGKTLAALYPAVRALGKAKGEKIFYFTPKTTGAIAAADAAELLRSAGADLRAVLITAKAKICQTHADCRTAGHTCRYLYSSGERETHAALTLLESGKTVVTPEDIQRLAEKERVCPYELTLRYAEMCDLVICDYNYLFDLRVYFRRFFDRGGDYLYLIDEAHALVERAREMYSGEWSLSDIESIASKIKKECKLYATIQGIRESFIKAFAPYLKDATQKDADGNVTAFLSLSDFPERGFSVFSQLRDALEHALKEKDEELGIGKHELREEYYRISAFTEKLCYYSRKFRCFLMREGRRLTVRIYCMDPSDMLRKRLDTGRAAFFFSGTLLPIDYYKTVLGGDETSLTLVAESPFDRSRAAVAILDRLSVRFHEREGGITALLSAIEAAVFSRCGNYMVFCPSYSYMEAVAAAFAERNPTVRTVVQEKSMTEAWRRRYLSAFVPEPKATLVGFAVSGGIFAEGIDLTGDRLIGAVVVGVGLPTPSPERDAVAEYYDERFDAGREFAYLYPGMNRVLQAAGRVIRRENDRGIILLIDDRLSDPAYKRILPNHWRGLKYIGDTESLTAYLSSFWKKEE